MEPACILPSGSGLRRHPRFKLHFTPTRSSWLNLVERWFRKLTDKSIRRGVFRSVGQLARTIRAFIAAYNADSQAFDLDGECALDHHEGQPL